VNDQTLTMLSRESTPRPSSTVSIQSLLDEAAQSQSGALTHTYQSYHAVTSHTANNGKGKERVSQDDTVSRLIPKHFVQYAISDLILVSAERRKSQDASMAINTPVCGATHAASRRDAHRVT